jgi:putative SOS response-associated peptidase YedK
MLAITHRLLLITRIMCGRFTLHHSTEEVAERFAVQELLFPLEARYNIAPAQAVPVVANSPLSGAIL